jgi:hypothetical protein
MRTFLLSSLVVWSCGCGGSGGGGVGGGGPLGFAPGPTTTATVAPGHGGTHTFVDLELADHDDDGTQDIGYVVTASPMFTFAFESMRGLGDGSFGASYERPSFASADFPRVTSGEVFGPGKEGFVFSAVVGSSPVSSGVATVGYRTVGMITTDIGDSDFQEGGPSLTVGDWNGDGVEEPAIGGGDLVQWLSILGVGLWPPLLTPLPVGFATFGITSGDWDGDGDDDPFVVAGFSEFSYVTFTGPQAGVEVPVSATQTMFESVSGDFDGDGLSDVAGVVFESAQPVRLGFLKGQGDGTFAAMVLTTPTDVTLNALGTNHLHAGDLDGDGRTDLALVVPGGDQTCVFLGTTTGQFAFFADPELVGGGNDVLALGDVDNDGDLDLVIGNAATLGVRTLLNERF